MSARYLKTHRKFPFAKLVDTYCGTKTKHGSPLIGKAVDCLRCLKKMRKYGIEAES